MLNMSANNTEFYKPPVNRSELSIALKYVIKLFRNIEYAIFFGTLLGITREGDLINGDDDIDLVIPLKFRTDVIEIIKKSHIDLDMNKRVNSSQYFLQGEYKVKASTILIDVYFFEDFKSNKILIKSMRGPLLSNNKKFWIKILKKDFYPIEEAKYENNTLKLPRDPKKLLNFIYGKNWRFPLKKGQDYFHFYIFNRPILFRNKLLIAFLKYQQHNSFIKIGHSLIHYFLSTKLVRSFLKFKHR